MPHMLDPTEREILSLSARGLTTDQIAVELLMDRSTVRQHLNRSIVQLGASSKLEAVIKSIRWGLIPHPTHSTTGDNQQWTN